MAVKMFVRTTTQVGCPLLSSHLIEGNKDMSKSIPRGILPRGTFPHIYLKLGKVQAYDFCEIGFASITGLRLKGIQNLSAFIRQSIAERNVDNYCNNYHNNYHDNYCNNYRS